MTLREFVESGPVGTHEERAAFETGLVEAHARALELGVPTPGNGAIDANAQADLWVIAFVFARLLHGERK